MDELTLLETEHTKVSQAYGFRVPGYVIVQPKAACAGLADLDTSQAADLMRCLALAEGVVREAIAPERLYVLKFGEENPQIHFHVIPRTAEIERAYLAQVPDGKPYSGARIVDWLWLHHESLGYTESEIGEFVSSARALIEQEAQPAQDAIGAEQA
jgi:diadenosine tetraphosphate (Ap4A) HIT family hydrolase